MTEYDLSATMPWSNTIANFRTVLPSPRSCFIVGATGEVGKRLVHHVLSASAFDRVLVIGRRPIGYEGPNVNILEERIIADFDELELASHEHLLDGCQFGFCALGTTRAKAGSPEAFRRVDHDYVLTVGRLAKKAGCRWFGLVSASGANAGSYFLYPQTKGDTEDHLIALELAHLYIYRPALLICERQESRWLERLGIWMAPLLNFVTGGRAAIPTDTVARAMLIDALDTAVAVAQGEPRPSVKYISNQAMSDAVKLEGLV